MFKDLLLVFIGSGLGGACRFAVSRLCATSLAGSFPWGTFTVNVMGCLLIGLINGLFTRGAFGSVEIRTILTVGFCGGFTTFSTFLNDSFSLFRADQFITAIGYLVASVALGFVAVALGYWLAK